MASNNYAETILDPVKAAVVLTELIRMMKAGKKFWLLEFDPEFDQFSIAGHRWSSYPSLDYLEMGIIIGGVDLLMMIGSEASTVDFGNGHFGVCFEHHGRVVYMATISQEEPCY